MAIVWGAWAGPNYERVRAGIEVTASGTKMTVKYYAEAQSNINDAQKMTLTKSITGTKSYTLHKPSGGSMLVDTRTLTGVRGLAYAFGAKITGVYTGATPEVSTMFLVPPAPPGAPTIGSVTAQGSSITVNWSNGAGNGGSFTRSQVQFATNAAFTANVSSGYPTGLTRTFTAKTAAPQTTYWVRVRHENSAGWGAWSSVKTVTTPPQVPLAPTGFTAVRVNDARQDLAWTRTHTAAAPWQNVVILRKDVAPNGVESTFMVRLAGTATTYSDTATAPNKRYIYTVHAENAGGAGASTPPVERYTTPPALVSVQAVHTAPNITVSWARPANAQYGTSVQIEHKEGAGAWALLTTIGALGPSSYTHSAVNPATAHVYRARLITPDLLPGAWAESNAVPLAAPPAAPVPGGEVVADAAEPVRLEWVHAPVDASSQTKFQYRWRTGGPWAEEPAATATAGTAVIPGGTHANGETLEWQVRTWGAHPDPSPWSATAAITLTARPTAAIIYPVGGTHTVPLLSVTWAYGQAEAAPQAQFEIELRNDTGAMAEARAGDGGALGYPLETRLPDGTAWAVRVRVRSSLGLWSQWAEESFVVNYPEPPAPVVTAEYQQATGSALVQVENPPSQTVPMVKKNLVRDPSFETLGGLVEARRNIMRRPVWAASSFEIKGSGVTVEDSGAGRIKVSMLGSSYAISMLVVGNESYPPGPRSLGVKIEAITNGRWQVGYRRDSDSGIGVKGTIDVLAGETYYFKTSHTTISYIGSAYFDIISKSGAAEAIFSEPIIELTPNIGPYFDGTKNNTGGGTVRWLGAVNNSNSVLEIVTVAGMQANPEHPGELARSAVWQRSGAHSLMIQPTTASSDSYALLNPATLGMKANTTYTLIVWVHVPEELTGYAAPGRVRRVLVGYAAAPDQFSPEYPNVPGVHELRWEFTTGPTAPTHMWIYNGYDVNGAGHQNRVYFDDLTIVEGTYSGPAFHGDTPPLTTQDGYSATFAWDGAANASPTTGSFGPAPEAERNTVQRSIDGGPWVTIGENVDINSSIIDPLPALNRVNCYRAVAWTAAPASSESAPFDLEARDPGWIFINAATAGYARFIKFYGNARPQGGVGREKTLHRFAGRPKPVAFFGEAITQKVAATARLTPGESSTLTEVESMHREAEIVCWRDAKGRRFFGVLDELKYTWEKAPNLVEITTGCEEVDHNEFYPG